MTVYRRARRRGYSWPRVTAIDPDHGAFRFSVHGIRKDGIITLMAFHGEPAADATKMVDSVFEVARTGGSEVVQLGESDVSEALAAFLAVRAAAKPETGVLVAVGAEWGIGR